MCLVLIVTLWRGMICAAVQGTQVHYLGLHLDKTTVELLQLLQQLCSSPHPGFLMRRSLDSAACKRFPPASVQAYTHKKVVYHNCSPYSYIDF